MTVIVNRLAVNELLDSWKLQQRGTVMLHGCVGGNKLISQGTKKATLVCFLENKVEWGKLDHGES